MSAAGERDDFRHRPVMNDEIVALFAPVPPGTVVDATLGGGGHSAALLDAHEHLDVLGIDRDPDAIEAARRRLAPFAGRVRTSARRFDELEAALEEHDIERISGALFDLGVSSPQLDRAERGFSYRNEGPLDMRMDTAQRWSADDVVNGYDERDLARIIRRYGDERFATRIAAAICAARPIETTTQLAAVVTAAIPAPARRSGGHPAKRTFQAIRIEVNAELDALPEALDKAIDALTPGGRLAVLSYHSGEDRIAKDRIRNEVNGELDALPEALDQAVDATVPGGRIAVLSYHSGEDRIVKQRFVEALGGCDCPPELPCVCGAVQTVRIVRGVSKRPRGEEVEANPRAASARLRVVEKIEPVRTSDRRRVPPTGAGGS
jgi:16S rRNA (cytosine1402-N4)-methyltransferase